LTADCYFQANKVAKTPQIAQYFADLATICTQKGIKRMEVFLDQNPTHKNKMKHYCAELTQHLDIKIYFHFIAAYSPKLNLVEYAIHLIRQKVLHHADYKKTLDDFEIQIKQLCDNQKILNKEQIINILEHIENITPKNTNITPKRE
jgi:transposase